MIMRKRQHRQARAHLAAETLAAYRDMKALEAKWGGRPEDPQQCQAHDKARHTVKKAIGMCPVHMDPEGEERDRLRELREAAGFDEQVPAKGL